MQSERNRRSNAPVRFNSTSGSDAVSPHSFEQLTDSWYVPYVAHALAGKQTHLRNASCVVLSGGAALIAKYRRSVTAFAEYIGFTGTLSDGGAACRLVHLRCFSAQRAKI